MFIKLHITAQSGPVILLIICHSHCSSQGGINDTCYDVCVSCTTIYSIIRLPTRCRVQPVQQRYSTYELTFTQCPKKYILHRCRNGMKKKTVTKNVLLPIEIHVALFGVQATHKLPQSCRQTSTVAAMVFKITNSKKGTAAHRDKCGTVRSLWPWPHWSIRSL